MKASSVYHHIRFAGNAIEQRGLPHLKVPAGDWTQPAGKTQWAKLSTPDTALPPEWHAENTLKSLGVVLDFCTFLHRCRLDFFSFLTCQYQPSSVREWEIARKQKPYTSKTPASRRVSITACVALVQLADSPERASTAWQALALSPQSLVQQTLAKNNAEKCRCKMLFSACSLRGCICMHGGWQI